MSLITGHKRTFLLLTLVLLVGAALRMYHINSYGSWYDEQCSILAANGQVPVYHQNETTIVSASELQAQNDLSHVVTANALLDSGNAIAYTTVLHYWLMCFGNSDFSARMLSVLFALLSILLVYRLGELLLRNKQTALFFAFTLAIHPLHIMYGQEARTYSMATFFCLLASFHFFRLFLSVGRRTDFLIYTIAAVIAMLSHYLCVSVFIAHALLMICFQRDKRKLLQFTGAGLTALALFGCWMYFKGWESWGYATARNNNYTQLAASYQHGTNTYFIPATGSNILTGWLQTWLQITGNTFQNFGYRIREVGLFLVLPVSLLIIGYRYYRRLDPSNRFFFWMGILVITQTGLATLSAMLSGHCISFQPLYTTFVVPFATVLLGASVFAALQNRRPLQIALVTSFMLVLLVSLLPRYENYGNIRPNGNRYADYAAALNDSGPRNDTLLIETMTEAQLISLYLDSETNVYFRVEVHP